MNYKNFCRQRKKFDSAGVDKILSLEQLGDYFSGNKNATNGIVLVSCNDLDAAKAFSTTYSEQCTKISLSLSMNGFQNKILPRSR